MNRNNKRPPLKIILPLYFSIKSRKIGYLIRQERKFYPDRKKRRRFFHLEHIIILSRFGQKELVGEIFSPK